MQGNKSVVWLKSIGSPSEVNTKMQKSNDEGGTNEFSVEMCITYSLGNTLVTMNITEEGCSGRVKAVYIDLSEDSGKGSSANLRLRLRRNERDGILCNYMKTKFVGSYDSCEEKYCAPPLSQREVVRYFCRESGSGGCFTLEKKKDEYGAAVRVKATHDLVVDEETMHVKVKIRSDDGGREEGLNVEVEGPVKLTREYMNHVVSRMERKMRSAIEASTVPIVRNGAGRGLVKVDGSSDPVPDERVEFRMSCKEEIGDDEI